MSSVKAISQELQFRNEIDNASKNAPSGSPVIDRQRYECWPVQLARDSTKVRLSPLRLFEQDVEALATTASHKGAEAASGDVPIMAYGMAGVRVYVETDKRPIDGGQMVGPAMLLVNIEGGTPRLYERADPALKSQCEQLIAEDIEMTMAMQQGRMTRSPASHAHRGADRRIKSAEEAQAGATTTEQDRQMEQVRSDVENARGFGY
jgi:hypothetical protein